MAKVSADVVHLRASGVSLVVAVGDRRLPRVVHWGADLGDDDAPELGDDRSGERRAVALLPEHSWGWMGTPGIAGHRDGRDHSTRFVTSSVDQTTEGEAARSLQRLTVHAADAAADLALTVVIEMLASGLVRARATIASTGGDAPYTVDATTLTLPVPARARELAPYPGRDDRLPFGRGTHARESRRGTPGRDGAALLAAGMEGFGHRSGEVWVTHVAWSGNVRHLAERGDDGARTVGGGELLFPGEVRLEPGESYASPWVYFSYGAGLDEASARFHRFLRARPDHPAKPRPIVATTAGVEMSVERLTALADASAGVGAELFVLGDGWFKGGNGLGGGGGLGDWYVDKAVFPEGLRPFADYVRGLGLEFGLYFAPEMISVTSDLAREHPEWIAQPSLAGASLRLPLERRGQHVLDLTNPDALAHLEERLHALVEELRPTHLVWDHRRDLVEAGSPTSGRAIGHAQTQAFYELLGSLRGAFPALEIEVRSGGAGRSDLEVLQRAQRVRASEAADAFDTAAATALLVPPELIGLDIPARDMRARAGAPGRGGVDDRAGAALWGHLGVEWSVADPIPSAERLADLRAWVELHKRYRKLVHTGEVVRSDALGRAVGLRGIVSGNRREALFACAPPEAASPDAAPLLHLEGLDPARAYRVTVVRDPSDPSDPSDSRDSREREAPGDAVAPGWWEGGVIVSGRMLAAHGIQAPPRGRSGVVFLRVERAKAAPHRF
jgi:alpha-galactosidase